MKSIIVALIVALALVGHRAEAKGGFSALTITFDLPFEDWYPYKVKNTNDSPVCFSYSVCDDHGPPDVNGHIGNVHKRVCVTKKAKLKPGEVLDPDQNYGAPSITNVRSC